MERLGEYFPYFLNLFLFYSLVFSIYSPLYLLYYSLENKNKQSWLFSRYSGFHVNWCVPFVSPFNMVSQWDNEHTLETLENTTNDRNPTEETAISFSVTVATVIDARMSAAMDEWFSRLQKTFENKFPSVL